MIFPLIIVGLILFFFSCFAVTTLETFPLRFREVTTHSVDRNEKRVNGINLKQYLYYNRGWEDRCNNPITFGLGHKVSELILYPGPNMFAGSEGQKGEIISSSTNENLVSICICPEDLSIV